MPVGGALFGSSAARGQSKHLVECKAGKMTMKGKMVYPDKRKGLLYVYQSDDSLMHFCWKDRQSGTLEDDLIIFPEDCEFKRVTQCTTGRVYVLKFRSSNRKLFFWVQDPKTDKDDENCRRFNEVLNNPPTPGSQRSGGATPDGDLQNLLNNMSQQQLMQLFGGVNQMGGLSSLLGTIARPSTGQNTRSSSTTTSGGTSTTSTPAAVASSTAPAAAVTTPSPAATARPKPADSAEAPKSGSSGNKPPIQLSDLQNFLSGLHVPAPESSDSRNVDLSAALTSDNLQSMLGDPALVRELQQHLPSVSQPGNTPPPASEQLRATLASPQFQQSLSQFSTALQSGQLGPVISQFEVGNDAVAAANQGNMEEFVKALQNANLGKDEEEKQPGGDEKRKKRNDGKKEDPKGDKREDDGMNLD